MSRNPTAEQPSTQRQLRYLQAVAREAGIDPKALDDISMKEYGVVAHALSRKQASELIASIQDRRT